MSLETLAFTISGVDWSGIGDKIYADAAINDGTSFALDFSNTACWPSQGNAATGAVFSDLTGLGNTASVTGAVTLTFAGSGFAFGVTDGQTIALPEAAKLADCTDGFAVAFCFRASTQTQSAKSRAAGYFDGSDNTGPWGVYGSSNRTYFVANSQVLTSKTLAELGGEGAIVSAVMAWVNAGTAEAPDWRARLYINGALQIDAAASYPTLQAPTDVTTPTIGESSDDETAAYWIGRVYRVFAHDLSVADIDDVVAAEWAQVQTLPLS